MTARAAAPPTTPPAMAPTLLLEWCVGTGVVVPVDPCVWLVVDEGPAAALVDAGATPSHKGCTSGPFEVPYDP